MSIEATSPNNVGGKPGMKNWLLQIVPPSLMLGVFLTTTSGTSLVFLVGFLALPVLISLISIITKLIFYKKRKYYLVRPALTITIFILILVIANWTYQVALDQSVSAARTIHRQCNENATCPENPAGWQVDGFRVSRNDPGFWLKYTASYYYDEQSFEIYLYRGPDVGDNITGGVDLEFKVFPYEEG